MTEEVKDAAQMDNAIQGNSIQEKDPLTELEQEINQEFEDQRNGTVSSPIAVKDKDDQETSSDLDKKAASYDKTGNPSANQNQPPQERVSEKEDSSKPSEELQSLSKKVESLNERLYENQRFARSINQNRANAISQIQRDIEDGELSEEVGDKLLKLLNTTSVKEPEELSKAETTPQHQNPFQKFFTIASTDVVQNYLEVTEDELYEDKAKAFGAFLSEATQEELDTLYKELELLETRPTSLLKKMLEHGKAYLDEGFGEFMKAGGFRKYSFTKNTEIETLNKKIDKLEKKVLKYESYDKPTYRMDELNKGDEARESESADPLNPIFSYPIVGKANHRR